MPDFIVLLVTLLGLGIGLGIGFLKMIPKMVTGIISLIATFVVAVMLWNLLGLPAIALVERFASIAWVLGLSIGLIAGERIGALF